MNTPIPSQTFPNPTRNPLFYKPFPRQIELIDHLEPLPFFDDFTQEEDPPLESDWHVAATALLVNILRDYWTEQNDIYVSGNTVVRFDPNQKQRFRGPDLYVVKGVTDKGFRRSWRSWEENHKNPHFILELLSNSTAHFDVTGKKDIYEQQLKTPEYVVYNPETGKLQGWRLVQNRYQPITPNPQGWLWCEEIGLWLGLADYQFFQNRVTIQIPRFFDKTGQLLLTRDEAQAQRAKAEKQRADLAEAKLERLQTLLKEKGLSLDDL
jgi:Uma2 family endonuclease